MKQYLGKKTFLGVGLGAVQAGLMLYEAFKSNNFERYIILEVNAEIVNSIKKSGNKIVINIAKKNGITKSTISNFEIYNPNDPADYDSVVSSIYQADEMATAIPSVDFYDIGKNSIARLLAENINPNKPQIVYTAENNNYAAEMLLEKIKNYTDEYKLKQFQTINTVIGKMGGVIFDTETVKELDLDWMTPYSKTAILVEEFNNIIISKITLPGFQKGIEVFQEKDDLLPFEEAKLFGHNAVHSMLGFFAALRGYSYMSEIKNDIYLYQLGIDAFKNESGAFLLKKYKNLDEPLFTPEGFKFYGEDLLERMTNPYLRDEVKRICRDPVRKLEYNDRLFGTIKEALKQNVYPKILIKAVLGGICYLIKDKVDSNTTYPADIEHINENSVKEILKEIWKDDSSNPESSELIDLVCSELNDFFEEFINIKKY
jgi:mannitol-1-phosphate 5-dehydrogenase